MHRQYQICTRCVMDTGAKDITFDEEGVCNYCTEFLEKFGHILFKDPAERQRELEALVAKVKARGKGKCYDCVIGVSGGVDSSWALVQAVKFGLRPLAVHMDNGWNSELAQNNIANLVQELNVDLYTHVIDWYEYRQLMQAFFDADVVDIELLYDNAMLAVNYQEANKYGIKFILAGTNQATEGLSMPPGWNWYKYDKRNIYGVAKQFGNVKIKTFPAIGVIQYIYFEFIKKIKWVSFLDYLPYNKFDSLDTLEAEYGYKRYPFKHYESVFTRFYQGYILPNKFNVDKRLVHLSTLIISDQMTREEALEGLQGIPYSSEQHLEEDIAYFIKKMGWSRSELVEYLSRPEIYHTAYPTEKKLSDFLIKSGRKLLSSFMKDHLKKKF